MANEITLKTRLLNLYENSSTLNPRFNSESTDENIKLKKGEILFHEEMVATDKGETPVVLMKVGDGTTTNDKLNVVAARAADVYAWAKEAGLSVTVDSASKGNVVASVSWDSDNNTLKVVKTDAVTPDELKAVTDLIGTLPTTTTAKTIVEYVDKKTEGIATSGALTELSNKVTGVETAISKLDETYATDAALNAVKKTAENATTVSQVDAQIVAKINALKEEDLWDAKGDAAKAQAAAEATAAADATSKASAAQAAAISTAAADAKTKADAAEAAAKAYADDLKADLLGEGAISETYNTLKEIADWIEGNGVDATELTSAIAAEAKLREEADTALSNRIKVYEDNKSLYALKTEVEAAQTAAATDATTKANTAESNAKNHANNLNTAMGTRVKALEDIDHDAYKAADTALHETISAEIDADVKALADGAVKTNTEAIAAINDTTSGILAQAKKYADDNDKDTTYTAGEGIAIGADNKISNTGVRTVATGEKNGTIAVNGSDVAVKGLGTAAYTNSNAYDAAGAAAGVKSALIGTDNDTKDSETIKGAKKYADSLNGNMDARVKVIEGAKHTHDNKTTLDKITEQNLTDWNDAVTKGHTHSNKVVLDEITSDKITAWDNEVGAKEIANGKTTTAEVKNQIEAYGYATTGQVATAKTEAVNEVKSFYKVTDGFDAEAFKKGEIKLLDKDSGFTFILDANA